MNKQRVTTIVKVALGLLAALVISPIIYMIVQGIVGLIIALVLGLILVNGAPWLAMKFANWKLLALKDEARRNPIETRQNLGIKMREQLAAQQVSLKELIAEVRQSAAEVKTLPPEDAADFQEQVYNLERLVEHRKAKYATAATACDEFDAATARAERKWRVAQSISKTNKLAGRAADKEMDRILASESLNSVEKAMHTAFAELEASMAEVPAIPHAPAQGLVIDVSAHQKVNVS